MNLFTSKKYYSDNGVCSFHEFARELDEDYLRTQVNGGDCGGGAPSGTGGSGGSGSGGGTGHGTGGTSSSGATTTPQAPAVNPGAGETQNPGNQSNPGYTGGGGNYEPPKEVMSNPQAYAYWLSLQDKAMKEGDPGKYKDYNVVPDYKQNSVDKYLVEKEYGKTRIWSSLQGIGFNCGSIYKTTCTVDSKNKTLTVFTIGNYLGKNLESVSSDDMNGNVELYIDGQKVNEKKYEKPTYAYFSDGLYNKTVGETVFNLPETYSSISIKTNLDVRIDEVEGGGALIYFPEKINILGGK